MFWWCAAIFTGGAHHFAVRDSRLGLYSGVIDKFADYPFQKHGVQVDAGCDHYVITGNMLTDNVQANLVDNGGPNKVVANNLT